jgi:hypothetical protein
MERIELGRELRADALAGDLASDLGPLGAHRVDGALDHRPGDLAPELLGGGRTILVSMLVQRNVELYHAWGAASAVGLVLLFVVFLIFWGINRFINIERILGAR